MENIDRATWIVREGQSKRYEDGVKLSLQIMELLIVEGSLPSPDPQIWIDEAAPAGSTGSTSLVFHDKIPQ